MKQILIIVLLIISFMLKAQSITSWTEENSTLGLGYPVPIPVETAEPFDGFRTYNALLMKHQSMALNNDNISGHIVGKTVDNRDIWAYVLSDDNNITKYGVKEGAMLVNGNIHAREWQSPEVLTGIMELLDSNSQDHSLHQYLLENTSIVALPVNNVDGLLQTQRFPAQNWYSGQVGPRDGRMRRKNMRNVDEDLFSQADFLLGVDLNRNNSPYWATSSSSSANVSSIVYHGLSSESEPETQARLVAAELVDSEQVRVYTDVHSFTKVHFSVRTNNANRNTLQASLLSDFTSHHRAFPAAKNYVDSPSGPGGGIGSTDEYFAETYQVPSWTLEIEPSNSGGVEYGGFGNNNHDGFILPESQIKRVREQLAQTFMVVWYGQAGPPSITQFKIIENESKTVFYDARWDIQADGTRMLVENIVDNLIAGGKYSLIIGFDKPMRTRDEQGKIQHLQGQSGFTLEPNIESAIAGEAVVFSNGQWLNEKSSDVISYQYYQDDTYTVDFTVPEDIVVVESSMLSFAINVSDMVGQKLDANPESVVSWTNGQWQNYEDDNGASSITGGTDSHYSVSVGLSSIHSFEPVLQPTGLYFDPNRDGEGFSYELLGGIEGPLWVQWFTYDDQGKQRWYSGVGMYEANRIIVNTLTQASGGVFGEDFDASLISFDPFGSLEIIFSGGEPLDPPIGFHTQTRTAKVVFTDLEGKKLKTNMVQLSYVLGALSNQNLIFPAEVVENPLALITGSWYDPTRSGEGYVIEILEKGTAILLWYTYDLQGNHMWLIDSSGVITENGNDITLDFNNVLVTNGGVFGEDFNPDEVNKVPWGELHFQLNCLGDGTVDYSSNISEIGSGQYNVTRLTRPLIFPFSCQMN